MEHRNAVGVLILRRNLVQFCQRLPGASGRHVGYWGGTGGLREPGETDVEACARETEEESGVVAAPARFIFLHQNEGQTDAFTYTARHFLLRLEPGEKLEQRQPDKHGPWKDVPPTMALAMVKLIPGLKDALREALGRGLII